ncbi:hypothetical protein [Bradyrhizobium sp. RT10b]|uniref:hypothetical protein n=1 Tax=Bradyrhizobium sp. RT10b TaxID=3156331 RepID=UPI003390BCEF
MKLLAPIGTSSISLGGESLEIDNDGTVTVSGVAAVRELCDTHGFTIFNAEKPAAPAEKPPVDKFTDMSRAEIIGYIKSKGLPVVPQTGTEELRAAARLQYSPDERAADDAAAKAAAEAGK